MNNYFYARITKIFCIVLIVFVTDSCSRKMQKLFPNLPDKKMKKQLEDSSPEFKAGWQDGCEVGISSGSNTFYKAFYQSNRVDGYRMAGSQDYRDAWEFAFWYCFRSTYIRQKSSIWNSIFKGYR